MKDTLVYKIDGMIMVVLSDKDLAFALNKGLERYDYNWKGKPDWRGAMQSDNQSKFITVHGTVGEFTVAKALGILWDGDIRTDVGRFEVKAMDMPTKHLSIPQSAKKASTSRDQIYIGVWSQTATPECNVWFINGWAYAQEIMKSEYLDDCGQPERGKDKKLYLLPHDKLRPMDTLPSTESTTEENSGKTICPESGKSEL